MKKLIARLFGIALFERVVNQKRRFGSLDSYYRVTTYKYSDGEHQEVKLLLTANEFLTASKRALENEEDFA